jgi:hypothetical protein
MSHFLLRTDEDGHRWEIRFLDDRTVEHRREGRTNWEAGWPVSLPPNENPSGAKLVQNNLTHHDP